MSRVFLSHNRPAIYLYGGETPLFSKISGREAFGAAKLPFFGLFANIQGAKVGYSPPGTWLEGGGHPPPPSTPALGGYSRNRGASKCGHLTREGGTFFKAPMPPLVSANICTSTASSSFSMPIFFQSFIVELTNLLAANSNHVFPSPTFLRWLFFSWNICFNILLSFIFS